MKTVGLGVDIIKNKRISDLLSNKKFIERIFGKDEIINSNKVKNKTNYFAKRFAAKESLSKALGTGFRKGLNFKNIQILNNKLGKPYYLLNNSLKNMIKKKKKIQKFQLFLSISDEKDYSIAFTIIQSLK
jgi:holo-[acyl-carrier protein] synthase|tara:strand:- start:190 stop:579 length:390 start_codon:yes stop_codon:yes gene_type:complete